MKAVAITPRQPGTLRLVDVPLPTLDSVPEGRGVLVRVLRVGLDGTDREIVAGAYGDAPAGMDFLIPGHEGLGVVEAVGAEVTELVPGDLVAAIVRRPRGSSIYDTIGRPDFTTDDVYFEHGISHLQGFLAEYYVDAPDFLVRIPGGLADVGVLLEPTSIVEKGINEAYEIQRRLGLWRPRRAAVLGAGPLGLLATMALRLRGLDVTTLGLQELPYRNAELIQQLRARYVSTRRRSLSETCAGLGPFDLIFEATGYSPLVFEAMQVLGKDGVLVLSSVTGGTRMVEVDADAINLSFVLGNKVVVGTVNAGRDDFEAGVRDLAVAQVRWPGWLQSLITHRVRGLEQFGDAYGVLGAGDGAIKVVIDISDN